MTFLSIVLRDLTRRPIRTGLTLVGISIGIAAVVALVGIARGFEKSWESGLNSRGTDVVVSNMSKALTPKPFPAAVQEKVGKVPGVADTCGLFVEFLSIENSQMVMVSARQWEGYTWRNLKIISGRMPRDATEKAVVLGQTAAEVLNKKAGDPIQIETTELTVTGIVDGGALVENGCVILSLPVYQEVSGNGSQINVIDVRLAAGTTDQDAKKICDEINRVAPEAKATLMKNHLNDSQGYRMIRAMSWGTSLLAVLVGVLGVMNTMLMTVFERTHELCVLLALGWKRSRIVRMVLYESALLGFFGGIIGVALGAAGVKLMQQTKAIRGLLEPDLSPQLLLVSVAIAVVVGLVSGIYPAWRSSRLSPGNALHG